MRRSVFPAASISLLLVLLGVPFIRLAGLHVDASSELACFYPCSHPIFRPIVFGYEVPLMVLPYLGTLKAWLYQPILSTLEITGTVLRLPLLLVGAASIWMFFVLLDRIAGRGAAVAGSLLLATDASFVISTSIDYGPIVLLHFFLLAGILLLWKLDQSESDRYLALAFLVFGLALWHKALFIWMLVGLSAAALAVFPRKLWQRFSARRLGIAVFCLCLGAAPLLYYNVVSGGETVHTGKVMSANTTMSQRLLILRKSLDGSVLMGFLTEDSPRPESMRQPSGLPGRISARLYRAAGGPGWDGLLILFLGSCCLLPWLWFTPARPAALFAIVYLAVTWLQMAVVPNTGGALHHAILLWPFPHFLIAVAGAQLASRFGRPAARVLVAVLILAVGWNCLLLNGYVAQLTTGGTSATFTDAIYPLSDYVSSLGPKRFATVDWGYGESLCLLSDGEIQVDDISYTLLAQSDLQRVRELVAQKDAVFIGRPPADEQFVEVHARLNRIAQEMGYTRQILKVIEDRNHRPRFEVMQFVRRTESLTPNSAASKRPDSR